MLIMQLRIGRFVPSRHEVTLFSHRVTDNRLACVTARRHLARPRLREAGPAATA
jgi:hypothetical protein